MEKEYLKKLEQFIAREYGLKATGITPAKRGFFGETWCLSAAGAQYFVKIDYWDYHKELYRKSFETVDFMRQRGIDFILCPQRTLGGGLCCDFGGGVLGVFDYVPGENHEDYPVYRLFEKLAHIYRLDLKGLSLEKDVPDTAVLDKLAGLARRVSDLRGESPWAAQALSALDRRAEFLTATARKLEGHGALCRAKPWDLRITHGDAGGNCIFLGDSLTIIDWDHPVLAPPERDAWFFIQGEGDLASIEEALARKGAPYQFDANRLAYYCYRSFFHYICEYLMAFLAVDTEEKRQDFAQRLEGYFSSWVMNALRCADLLKW